MSSGDANGSIYTSAGVGGQTHKKAVTNSAATGKENMSSSYKADKQTADCPLSTEPVNSSNSARSKWNPSSIFSIPRPLKQLFDLTPLVVYPSNALPLRSSSAHAQQDYHTLYIFSTPALAESGAPSFNPGCLKWQAFLKFQRLPFRVVPSNNHASPSGALPFLLPRSQPSSSSNSNNNSNFAAQTAISSSKLDSWVHTQVEHGRHRENTLDAGSKTSESPQMATYHSLLTHNIRLAYLHALYLDLGTFDSLAAPLYIKTCSSNALVQTALSFPLRAAALAEVLNAAGPLAPAVSGTTGKVDVAALESDAEDAFGALAILLGDKHWFSELDASESSRGDTNPSSSPSSQPGLLDAAVFAYTHVILTYFAEQPAESPAARLARMVQKQQALCRHRDRILHEYF